MNGALVLGWAQLIEPIEQQASGSYLNGIYHKLLNQNITHVLPIQDFVINISSLGQPSNLRTHTKSQGPPTPRHVS